MKTFIKMYIWSIKESYNFMTGHHHKLSFWIKLPWKAFMITYLTLYKQ